MVFYLKYRPRKISELDSLEIREKFESTLKGKLPDKIAHAFLFTGAKGLGKTSTARILAKSINCTNRKGIEFEPCNKCSSCKSIDKGSNLDVLEIDGASNRGIDEIRDLREKIRLSPVSSLKKIYIIDEVHMLTTEAFNALLKTLEEPPAHAFFILCTTEPQKIPQTISSRCVHIKFTKPTEEDFLHSFNRIIKGEGVTADKDALLQVVKLSDGSFRDGAKILEELGNASRNITVDLIEKKYKTRSIELNILELIKSFEERDAKAGIKIVTEMAKEGIDFKLFTQELISTLHQRLISQVNGESFALDLSETKELIQMLIKSHLSIKYAILPQLPLELTIVEWCSEEVSSIKYQVLNDAGKDSGLKKKPEESSSRSDPGGTLGGKHDKILESLIEKVKKENFSIAGVLRGCRVERFDKKELVLSTGFKFHKEKLSDKKVLEMLEKFTAEITGDKTKVSIIFKE